MQRAVIYCRVDGPESEHTRTALQNQQAYLLDYAKRKNIEVTHTYLEEGFSGRSLERPGLRAVVQAVKDGGADMIIVTKRSRLFRGQWPEELRGLPVLAPMERDLER